MGNTKSKWRGLNFTAWVTLAMLVAQLIILGVTIFFSSATKASSDHAFGTKAAVEKAQSTLLDQHARDRATWLDQRKKDNEATNSKLQDFENRIRDAEQKAKEAAAEASSEAKAAIKAATAAEKAADRAIQITDRMLVDVRAVRSSSSATVSRLRESELVIRNLEELVRELRTRLNLRDEEIHRFVERSELATKAHTRVVERTEKLEKQVFGSTKTMLRINVYYRADSSQNVVDKAIKLKELLSDMGRKKGFLIDLVGSGPDEQALPYDPQQIGVDPPKADVWWKRKECRGQAQALQKAMKKLLAANGVKSQGDGKHDPSASQTLHMEVYIN